MEIADRPMAQGWFLMLHCVPNLQHLEIHLKDGPYGKGLAYDPTKSSLSAAVGLDCIGTLFEDYIKGELSRLELKSIQLMGFDLATAAKPSLCAIRADRLQTLGLQMCTNSDAVFNALVPGQEPAPLTLRSLVITDDTLAPEVGEDRSDVFNKVLESFRTLEYLIIKKPNNESYLPDSKSLAMHASTLRFVYLDCPSPGTGKGPTEVRQITATMQDALSKCDTLEQLVVNDPFSYWFPAWLADSNYPDAPARLPAIRTLRVLDHDIDPVDDEHVSENFANMESMASALFSTLPTLRALGLGNDCPNPANTDEDMNEETDIFYFTRGRTFDTRGREPVTPLKAMRTDMVDYEFMSDILFLYIRGGALLRYGYKP